MGIKSIEVKNILSFDSFVINDFSDINCFIGRNNVGKSNVLKVIEYFYKVMRGESVLPLALNSNYSSYGSIKICYDTDRLESVIRSFKDKSKYQKHIFTTLYGREERDILSLLSPRKKGVYYLTLTINRDNTLIWSEKNKSVRDIINRIYPFFFIDTRRVDLYNWKYLWDVVSKLKFLDTKNLSRDKIVDFFDSNISSKSNSYKEYVTKIQDITKTSPYDYQEMIFNYVKVGLSGHKFNIDGYELNTQSDGTNSYNFIELFLHLLFSLTRREFITPTVFIDEPEIGLHPKKCEELIYSINGVYKSYKSETEERVKGKYKNPFPKVFIATHSPNILKAIIREFNEESEHKVFHLNRIGGVTNVSEMNSSFKDKRFLNIFSDNEARLFFSSFILFVEGETELELFGNRKLRKLFPVMDKVDLCRVNSVILKAVNPQTSNISVPYIIIYDSDKLISIDSENRYITFSKANVNLEHIMRSRRLSYWGTPKHDSYLSLKNISKVQTNIFTYNANGTGFVKFSMPSLVHRLNKILYSELKTHLNETTIEGTLINSNSIPLLKRWIVNEYANGVNLVSNSNPNSFVSKVMQRFSSSYDCIKVFGILFGENRNTPDLLPQNILYCEKVKRDYLKNIYKKIFFGKGFSKEDRLSIFKLALNGKTETQVSVENKAYKTVIQQPIRDSVEQLQNEILKKLSIDTSKTGGWVSSFLDFAFFSFRSKSDKEIDIKREFSFYFPEVSNIIEKISSSIE